MFLALSVKVVLQEHLFVDHFQGNLQLQFSLNVPSKISITHALFKFSIATCRDIDMCFRRIKFRHKPLA